MQIKTFLNNHLPEDFIIYEDDNCSFSVDNYLHGSCHLFSLAFSELTGFKVGAFIDFVENDENGPTEYLEHAFCYDQKQPDYIIDCRGVSLKVDMWQQYTEHCFEPLEVTDFYKELNEWRLSGKLHNWGDDKLMISPELFNKHSNEKSILTHFIKDNIKKGYYPRPLTKQSKYSLK